eukprot:10344904-Heterocapsa_arctica.AAC.1
MAVCGPTPLLRRSRPLLSSASAPAARASAVLVEKTLRSATWAHRLGSRGPFGGFPAPLPDHLR